MKTRILASAVIGVFMAALYLTSASDAQQDAARQNENAQNAARQTDATTDRQQVNRSGNVSVGVLDEHTTGANIRASQLLGMNIENSKGDNVGEINDLVLDGNTGQVRYVAVTYGGFLGVGDKLFAVPFEAFHVRQQQGDPNDYVLTLDVTQKQLEGARGFDQETWPNFADRTFTRELDVRYGVDRSPRQATRPDRNLRNGAPNGFDNQNDVDNQNNLNRDTGVERNRQ